MNKALLFIPATLILLYGCRHNSDDHINLQISNLSSGIYSKTLTDTVKETQIYVLKYKTSEKYSALKPVVIRQSGLSEFTVTDECIYFKYLKSGRHSYSITVHNTNNDSSVCNLNLYVFDNWPPVAILKISIHDSTVVFDPRQSHDSDRKWGGYLIHHNFIIDNGGSSIDLNDTLIKILKPGKHRIMFDVEDNDYEMSDLIEREIIIQ